MRFCGLGDSGGSGVLPSLRNEDWASSPSFSPSSRADISLELCRRSPLAGGGAPDRPDAAGGDAA